MFKTLIDGCALIVFMLLNALFLILSFEGGIYGYVFGGLWIGLMLLGMNKEKISKKLFKDEEDDDEDEED